MRLISEGAGVILLIMWPAAVVYGLGHSAAFNAMLVRLFQLAGLA